MLKYAGRAGANRLAESTAVLGVDRDDAAHPAAVRDQSSGPTLIRGPEDGDDGGDDKRGDRGSDRHDDPVA